MTRISFHALLVLILCVVHTKAQAQPPLVVRPGPPPLENFGTDTDGDGIPDAWYNMRDAELVPTGGLVGSAFLRFENNLPSRPARISRGFGLDGRKHEAIIIGLWVRVKDILPGERLGEDPGLMVDMLGEDLRSTARPMLNFDPKELGEGWVRISKRLPVPPETRDAILTVGLLGATGRLDIDGLTFEEIPVGGSSTTNLILNGSFEQGTRAPDHWIVENGARRIHPGHRSDSALELFRSGARALIGLALPVQGLTRLNLTLNAQGQGLRGSGGAVAAFYFLDNDGRPLPGRAGSAPVLRWGGSFAWRAERAGTAVPSGATRAVLQFEKLDSLGALRVDHVKVVAEGAIGLGNPTWRPFHVATDTRNWVPFEAAEAIESSSALDFSFLLDMPAGEHGFVQSQGGRLMFEDGTPARFFGLSLLPPLAFATPERSEALADRLARSGVNLVRLSDLDAQLGPGAGLLDDASNDTTTIDLEALDNLDHFIAALKSRGIYVALELQSQARFRDDDAIAEHRQLPPGGGPAAAFDPALRDRALQVAEALLSHVNPHTGLALQDDPVLAWVTLAGELSLFNLIDDPNALPPGYSKALRDRATRERLGSGRRFWETVEANQWATLAEALRAGGLKVPIAGSSHWRREPEFVSVQAAEGLDLIDDRLFWSPPRFSSPDRRALLRQPPGSLSSMADRKRQAGRPYVVGQYASYTEGAWALPFEGADLVLVADLAVRQGWDALIRRGVARYPLHWGASASGTSGGADTYTYVEAINGIPQAFTLLPHVASILHRGSPSNALERARTPGRLLIETPFTIGLAGWFDDRPITLGDWRIQVNENFAVILISSATDEPIDKSQRLLVTLIAQAEPSGLRWADHWRVEVADPGRPPLLIEPIQAEITHRGSSTFSAHALDNAGQRRAAVPPASATNGQRFRLDGRTKTVHWELVVE